MEILIDRYSALCYNMRVVAKRNMETYKEEKKWIANFLWIIKVFKLISLI